MLRNARTRSTALHQRRCLSCGYAGRQAQVEIRAVDARQRGGVDRRTGVTPTLGADASHGDETDLVCPRCLCDFRVRPPRSYAEMEGLDLGDSELGQRLPRHATRRNDVGLDGRWLAFALGAVTILALVVSLLSTLMQQLR